MNMYELVVVISAMNMYEKWWGHKKLSSVGPMLNVTTCGLPVYSLLVRAAATLRYVISLTLYLLIS